MATEKSDSSVTTVIPDKIFEKAEVYGKWTGNSLSLYASVKNNSTFFDNKNEHVPRESNIYQLSPDMLLFTPVLRKLINESCCNFLSGQSLKNMPTSSSGPELLKLSRKYRSIIRANIENLQRDLHSKKNTDLELNKNIIGILYNIEFIWHLTEILHVQSDPGDVMIQQLVEWLNFHYPEAEKAVVNIINKSRFNQEIAISGVESHYPEFWNAIINLVLQGNLELVRTALKLHSLANTEMFLEADKALRQMPRLSTYVDLSMSEYITLWKAWHINVKDQVRVGLFSSDRNLEFIMKIIIGDLSIVSRVKQYCGTWYQYMIASLLYSEPTMKLYDLCYHAQQCISEYGGLSQMKLIDTIILALLNSDLKQAVKKFQQTSDCGWMAAHITNLLRLSGKLNFGDSVSKVISKASPLEEQLLLEYGTLLMKHKSLWQVGIRYLDHCSNGSSYIEAILLQMPLTTETKTLKIIDAAEERGLTNVVKGICKIKGQKYLDQNRFGEALQWACRFPNNIFATRIADKLLYQYSDIGLFTATDLLENLGPYILLCDRLTFLGKYYEFHQLYGVGKLKEASSLLSQLLESKMAPKYFWLTLLLDALPLLEYEDEPLFSSKETENLMFCLEELLNDENIAPASDILQQKTKLIRLALAKNLARAFIHEEHSNAKTNDLIVIR